VSGAKKTRSSLGMNQDAVEPSEAMNLTPCISVIVATFNCKDTLHRCINSVTDQTHANVELVIMDGAPTDGTVEILRENNGKVACWNSKPDHGIYHV